MAHDEQDPNGVVDGKLRQLLATYEPPGFPELILRALSQLRAGEPLSKVADTLSGDPRTTIKLLSIINSSAFAFRNPILSLSHAASLLGRPQLEALLLSLGVRKALPSPAGAGVQMPRFWFAAARRAALARALANEVEPEQASAAFTAGLLQDMAVPVMAAHAEDDYAALLSQWRSGDEDLADLEGRRYGFCHADVAGWLCERWQFPEELTAAIGTHHPPQRQYSSRPPAAVKLVAGLRESLGDYGLDAFVEAARLQTGLPSDQLLALAEQAAQDAAEVASLYA